MFSPQFMSSFWASTLENWQSEFLQLLTFVVLTIYVIHRHSPESRDSDDEMAADIRAIKLKLEKDQLSWFRPIQPRVKTVAVQESTGYRDLPGGKPIPRGDN